MITTVWQFLQQCLEGTHHFSLPLTIVLKSSLVILFATAMSFVVRRAPAAHRHLVWCFTLIAIFLLPLAVWLLPKVEVALLPPLALAPQKIEGISPLPQTEFLAAQEVLSVITPELAEISEPSSNALFPATPTQAIASEDQPFNLLASIPYMYALITLLLLAYLALGVVRLRIIARRLTDVDYMDAREMLDELCLQRGIRRKVQLLEHPHIVTPVTFGIIRPVILLPLDAKVWSTAALRASLSHELSHVARLDWFTHMLGRVVCAVHWFNPLVWMAARHQAMEAEFSCDDCVLQEGSKPSDYATHLLSLAKAASTSRVHYAAVAMASGSELSSRVRSILDKEQQRTNLGQRHLMASGVLGLGLLCCLAAFQPVSAMLPDYSRPDFSKLTVTSAPKIEQVASSDAPEKSVQTLPDLPKMTFQGSRQPQVQKFEQQQVVVDAVKPGEEVDLAPIDAVVQLPGLSPVSVSSSTLVRGPSPASQASQQLIARGGQAALYGHALQHLDGTSIHALPPLHDKKALPALTLAFEDTHVNARRVALRGMMHMVPDSSDGLLETALLDPAGSVRADALTALLQRRGKKGVPILDTMIHDPSPLVRLVALNGFAQNGETSHLVFLSELLTFDHGQTRAAAEQAIGSIIQRTRASKLHRMLETAPAILRPTLIEGLVERRYHKAASSIAMNLAHEEINVRQAAALALGSFKAAASVSLLQKVASAEQEHLGVRLAAIESLGRLPYRKAVETLSNLAGHEDWRIRAKSVVALGYHRQQKAIAQAMNDPHPSVRQAAVHASKEYPIQRTSLRSRWETELDAYGQPVTPTPRTMKNTMNQTSSQGMEFAAVDR